MARILMVDDDQDLLIISRKVLAASNHDVVTSISATEAIASLNHQSFDLLITDANMPQHSGFDLLRTLRKHERFAAMPIVMLTGRRDRKDIETALQLGATDYIIKPLDPILFVKKVDSILSRNGLGTAMAEAQIKNAYNAEATLHLRATIKSVSEMGFVMNSAHIIQEDIIIDMDIPFLKEIGVFVPHLKVLSCIRTKEGFETRVSFIGADDSTLQKIRSWVVQNTVRKAA